MCFVLFNATTTNCRRRHRYQRCTSQTVFDVFPLIIVVVAFRKHYAPQFAALWNVVGDVFVRPVLQSQSQSLRSPHELNPQFVLCGSRLRCSRTFVWSGSIGRREHVYEYLWSYAVFNVSSSSFRLDILLCSRFCKFNILQTLFILFTGWNILFLRCCLFHTIFKTKYLLYLRAIKTLQLLFHRIFIQICLVYHYLYK